MRRRIAALTLVVHLLLAVAVRRDARAADRNGALWTAATLVGGAFGAAAYLGTRD